MEISFKHHSPSFLDESCPITVVVTNNDEKELQFTLDVLLQPGDDDSGNVTFCCPQYYLHKYNIVPDFINLFILVSKNIVEVFVRFILLTEWNEGFPWNGHIDEE